MLLDETIKLYVKLLHLVLVLVLVIPGRTTYSPHSKASGVRASYGGLIRVLYYYHTIKTIAN